MQLPEHIISGLKHGCHRKLATTTTAIVYTAVGPQYIIVFFALPTIVQLVGAIVATTT